MGSHSAKSRQESGGVCRVLCPGKQLFGNFLDSSRPARGLLHTEEVTGSIPVSPTQLTGQSRSCDLPFLMPRTALGTVYGNPRHLGLSDAAIEAAAEVSRLQRGPVAGPGDGRVLGLPAELAHRHRVQRHQGGPKGPLAPPTRAAQPGFRFAPAWLASDARRLARKARRGRGIPGSHRAAADLTRGPLAAAPWG
jgi:hypothetical protein